MFFQNQNFTFESFSFGFQRESCNEVFCGRRHDRSLRQRGDPGSKRARLLKRLVLLLVLVLVLVLVLLVLLVLVLLMPLLLRLPRLLVLPSYRFCGGSGSR